MLSYFRGCILGLAVGDAIGYQVEFSSWGAIQKEYGLQGLSIADTLKWKYMLYSDDTQMSLASAWAALDFLKNGGDIGERTYKRYLDWLALQKQPRQSRAPGITCLSALRSGKMGTMKKPINNSKGCGGVMRTAPFGLVFDPEVAFGVGAMASAITHGHPSGYLPGGYIASLISFLLEGRTLLDAIGDVNKILREYPKHGETLTAVEGAVALAKGSKASVPETIHAIGGGWTGEEALAIAIYCSLIYSNDFPGAILAASNHSGDSDSTASITGAIMGAMLGDKAIPEEWIARIENRELLTRTANLLHKATQ